MKLIHVVIVTSLVAFMSGCATKTKEVYNKPASHWYDEISREIKEGVKGVSGVGARGKKKIIG